MGILIPQDLKYTRTHEWVKELGNGKVSMGISDFAQHHLGDIVFVNLPQVGESFVVGDTVSDMESVKAVSDVLCPVEGVVSAVNEELMDAPEGINQDPYGAWIVEFQEAELSPELLTPAEYQALCAAEGE